MDRILIVEDDGCLKASLAVALADEYDVRTANDGAEAVSVLQDNKVDLVLLDMIMPERDGFAVLSHVASMNPRPRVVVLSVLDQVDKVVKTMRLGASDYLVKPCDLKRLRRVLRYALAAAPSNTSFPSVVGPVQKA